MRTTLIAALLAACTLGCTWGRSHINQADFLVRAEAIQDGVSTEEPSSRDSPSTAMINVRRRSSFSECARAAISGTTPP